MPLIDNALMLSDAQAVTSVGSTDSDKNTPLDFEYATPNLGKGSKLHVNVIVDTTVASSGSATVQVKLQDSPDNSTWSDLLVSEAYAKAKLTAGFAMFNPGLPAEHERYLKLVYVVGTSALTAGKFNAWIGPEPVKSI